MIGDGVELSGTAVPGRDGHFDLVIGEDMADAASNEPALGPPVGVASQLEYIVVTMVSC
jgi:hypothetical protein